jgi:hypothetical protein
MKEFSLLGFARHLATMEAALEIERHRGLERAAEVVERRAKANIGHYQDAAPPFAPWAELAQATQDERVALGYPENEPLLRDGAMRDSIEHTVRGHEAHVGSDSDVAVFQELGTTRIPPRSFLGSAAVQSEGHVRRILGEHAVAALVGEEVVSGRLPIFGE